MVRFPVFDVASSRFWYLKFRRPDLAYLLPFLIIIRSIGASTGRRQERLRELASAQTKPRCVVHGLSVETRRSTYFTGLLKIKPANLGSFLYSCRSADKGLRFGVPHVLKNLT